LSNLTEPVTPMREPVCRDARLATPFRLVTPPYQKLPSSDTQVLNFQS
jgi:hypothetical protein